MRLITTFITITTITVTAEERREKEGRKEGVKKERSSRIASRREHCNKYE